ncbi:MAG: UDP-glucose/GDP-mannose dehydrogenase family protein [Sandaracinaceae bacterium]|nr:UDP-glucose/GDP-mannose dehydrogenase family protein [Myxococcales bacterium]MCB9656724.1 UDP-glucose/GDP-mannose dehydrogenase family protein [Sandaracinaceae bacterium]
MHVTVIGSGYVGLVTGACLAEAGNTVACVDRDAAKVASLARGEVPIYEPGLESMVRANLSSGRLTFSIDTAAAVLGADVVFLTVGTPGRRDGGADMRHVDAAAETVAQYARKSVVLVLKSTVPVGTNERVRRIVQHATHPVHVVSNPEFLKEGAALADFLRPERIVVGYAGDDRGVIALMERLYHPYCLSGSRLLWMTPASAELTKYVSNTMLAMRISFMNEVALLADAAGADIHDVRQAVGADSRIGDKFLHAGAGYGGSCFPKDVQALSVAGRDFGVSMELADATHRVNERQKTVIAAKLRARFGGDLRGRRIAVWGLAFKPETDDTREAPALTTIDVLLSEGAHIVAHDPKALDEFRRLRRDRVELVQSPYDALNGADALALHTEWREYQNPDFDLMRQRMARPLIVDGRNVWSSYDLSALGFEYEGIGVGRAGQRESWTPMVDGRVRPSVPRLVQPVRRTELDLRAGSADVL